MDSMTDGTDRQETEIQTPTLSILYANRTQETFCLSLATFPRLLRSRKYLDLTDRLKV